MSERDEYEVSEKSQIWHLTPKGWMAGDVNINGDLTPRPSPVDLVLSVRYEVRSAPRLGALESKTEVFQKPRSKKLIKRLIEEFGAVPQKISWE
jgi:hypothetical protein